MGGRLFLPRVSFSLPRTIRETKLPAAIRAKLTAWLVFPDTPWNKGTAYTRLQQYVIEASMASTRYKKKQSITYGRSKNASRRYVEINRVGHAPTVDSMLSAADVRVEEQESATDDAGGILCFGQLSIKSVSARIVNHICVL